MVLGCFLMWWLVECWWLKLLKLFNGWCFCMNKSCDLNASGDYMPVRETPETCKWPMKTVKPLTHTQTWGRGSIGMGTDWPRITQGYLWYSLVSQPHALHIITLSPTSFSSAVISFKLWCISRLLVPPVPTCMSVLQSRQQSLVSIVDLSFFLLN